MILDQDTATQFVSTFMGAISLIFNKKSRVVIVDS